MEYSQLFYPARFAVGQGSIKAISAFAADYNINKILIVTDGFLASAEGIKSVTTEIRKSGADYCIFNGVIANPSAEIIDLATAKYRTERCDCVLGFGGGSAIDTAKGVALTAGNGGSILNHLGMNATLYPAVPLIAVATTAGTGSEVTPAIVLTDRKNHTKTVSLDIHSLPLLAVSDPDLMLSLPREITAATALDALTHAMEAYCAAMHNPFSDGLALQAIALVAQGLPKVLAEPFDLKARTDLCWAASLAGYAFSNSGLGLMHSIGFSIENFCDVPHGVAVGIAAPYILDYHRREIPQRIIEIGRALGVDCDTDGSRAVRKCAELIRLAGNPTLAEIGFPQDRLSALTEMALADPTVGMDISDPTYEEMSEIVENIFCDNLN